MILFPNAKINLGLDILRKRSDGYHDISTVMIPVDWHDILEIVPASGKDTSLTRYGRPIDCPPEKDLVMKAYNAMATVVGGLPPANIYIEKIIPDGAGLGGGSSDAAFTLIGLNEVFNIGLDRKRLAEIAAMIGADCPFFIYNRPAYCSSTGTEISPDIKTGLSPYSILIAKPHVAAVSTAEAYSGVHTAVPDKDIREIISMPVSSWQGTLKNDFEASIFPRLPQVARIKDILLIHGAAYASMSGSGAAVYGIFENDKMAQDTLRHLTDCDTHVSPGCE